MRFSLGASRKDLPRYQGPERFFQEEKLASFVSLHLRWELSFLIRIGPSSGGKGLTLSFKISSGAPELVSPEKTRKIVIISPRHGKPSDLPARLGLWWIGIF